MRARPPRLGSRHRTSNRSTLRLPTDPYLERYAARTRGMAASEIRALFAVASRPEVVSLAGGMPYTAALDLAAVEQVVLEVLRRDTAGALQYGGGQGRPELREQLVAVMAAERVPAHPDDLVVTVGGQQALELIAKLFVNPGDVVLAEGPTYVGALGAFSSHQAEVRHVPMDAEGLIPAALDDALARLAAEGRSAAMLYTVPNHQNPAGVSLSEARRVEVAAIAQRHRLLVLEDNPYGLLDFAGSIATSLRALLPDQVVYAGTVSKTFAPGLRTGWVAAPWPIRDKLILLREAADLCQSSLTQMVVETWLQRQPWMEQVERFRAVYRERAATTLEALETHFPPGCTWTQPVGEFYIWMTLPHGMDSSALLTKALAKLVAFVPGRGFFADGGGTDQLRLCYSFPPPERLREDVAHLGEVLHEELALVEAVGVAADRTE